MTKTLRGVAVGAGYFSHFHYDAWTRLPNVEIQALCDQNEERARDVALRFGVPRVYREISAMLDAERPDFLDIITGPETHGPFTHLAAERGIDVICQKAFAPTFQEAAEIVQNAHRYGIRLMVHDNFRFQPWHREFRRQLDAGAIGKLHSITSRTRTGDGWSLDAYVSRQPYFRSMPRFLIFETGVHFIDVYRYLVGEVRQVFACLRRLNQSIVGEDAAVIFLEFEGERRGVWDANRYNESQSADPRLTFGEFLLEGYQGSLRLDEDGRMQIQRLGERPEALPYSFERRGFAGDCVFATLMHFIDCLRTGGPFETDGKDYLKTLAVQEAVYESARTGKPIEVRNPI